MDKIETVNHFLKEGCPAPRRTIYNTIYATWRINRRQQENGLSFGHLLKRQNTPRNREKKQIIMCKEQANLL